STPPPGLTSSRSENIYLLPTDELKLLWVLNVALRECPDPYLTAVQIEQILADQYGIPLSRQKIVALLNQMRDQRLVLRRKQDKALYRITRDGEQQLLATNGGGVIMIDPATAFSDLRRVDTILRSLIGTVRLCDPYVDTHTLDVLLEIDPSCVIQLLTVNIRDQSRFRRDLEGFRRQGRSLEVRIASASVLHDRYIIDDACMLLIGQSLNGLGKKQAFVVRVGDDIRRQTLDFFHKFWRESTTFA
ncbi:MAG: hypothetical protein AB1609_16675, partial [Bacillota bacterium]